MWPQATHGKLPCLPSDKIKNVRAFYNYDDYVQELKKWLQFALSKARDLIIKSKEKRISNDKYRNKFNLKVGELVLMKVENRKKHQSPYKGPYRIIERNGVNTTIDYNGTYKEIHNNNLKPYLIK